MKGKYTVRLELRIGEVLRIISYLRGVNEVEFVYSPSDKIFSYSFVV